MTKFYSELNATILGLVLGGIWAAVILLVSIAALIFKTYAVDLIYLIESVYPGYGLTIWGIPLGIIYGFIDGFICGYVTAWLYNRFIR